MLKRKHFLFFGELFVLAERPIGMLKEKYYFEFRFEEALKKRVLFHCQNQGMSLNRLMEAAFRFTAALHDGGKVPFAWKSRFLIRPDKNDRFSPMLILEKDVHEMVRNYAFAYRRSMAEILRVALELYLDHLESPNGKLDNTLHYYNNPVPVIKEVSAYLIPGFPPGIPPELYTKLFICIFLTSFYSKTPIHQLFAFTGPVLFPPGSSPCNLRACSSKYTRCRRRRRLLDAAR